MPNPKTARLDAAATAAHLDARDEWAVITTIGPDGYPHSVPLGYWRIDDALYLGTPDGTRKVRNIEHNAKVSVLVANSKASGAWTGVMIRGDAKIIRDDAQRLGDRARKPAAARRSRGETTHGPPPRRSDPPGDSAADDQLAIQLIPVQRRPLAVR